MSDKESNALFIENMRSTLETSLDEIDCETLAKIARARNRALQRQTQKNLLQLWIPLGALATAAIALMTFSLYTRTHVNTTAPLDDIELISNMDELELFEDLEFYEWLDEYELPT